jgi:hypothetical protein
MLRKGAMNMGDNGPIKPNGSQHAEKSNDPGKQGRSAAKKKSK